MRNQLLHKAFGHCLGNGDERARVSETIRHKTGTKRDQDDAGDSCFTHDD